MPKADTNTRIVKLTKLFFSGFLHLPARESRLQIKLHGFALTFITALAILAAGSGVSLADGIVTVQAESGTLGSNWAVSNSTSPAYITVLTTSTLTANPGSAAEVASYSVTFPSAGTYQLYARVLIGPGAFNSDSMFYANTFGSQSPTSSTAWVFVNGLAAAGFSNGTDVVTGGGTLGSGIWKWINLSEFAGNVSFTVSAGSLTQTFQIGGRELGLELDKFAFGTVGTAFTVSNLDTGTLPAPPPVTILTNAFPEPDGVALHRFSPLNSGINADGANPAAGLVLSGGVLLGTTLNGGSQGAGTAFWMTPDGTNFSTFRTFANAPDAGNPAGNLSLLGNSFFGTSLAGGNNGVGAVFLGNTNGSDSVLRSFSVVSADEATNSGGANPSALLALSGGMLYGTTTAGGVAAYGTIFSLTTNGVTFSVLHDFGLLDSQAGTNSDGAVPCGGLILSGGTLYGTTSVGGVGGCGGVFSISTNGGNFTNLYSFTPLDTLTATNTDGAMPLGGLVLSSNTLYGTTSAGGFGGSGTIFSIQTNGSGFSVLHHFTSTDPMMAANADGALPGAALLLSSNVLYGTAAAGGSGAAGTVFALNLSNLQFTSVHSFTALGANGTNMDGAYPVAPLLRLGNSLYGTAFSGGPGAAGTVFSVLIPAPPAVITNIVQNGDGTVTLSFVGAPNSTNVIQSTTSLTPPILWQNISTNVADANGTWQFTDDNALTTSRFYRSYVP